MNKIKFAIVGCGSIGKRHVAVVDADERAMVTALCDTDISKAEALSDLYGEIPIYRNYKQLINETEADIISICTPHGLHSEMAIFAAEAKKNVLVEKPMALKSSDARLMIEKARQNEVSLMVVKQNRFNVPITLTKKALDENKLGKIYMVQCNVLWNRNTEYYTESDWRGKKHLEGGALFTQVSHFIDLLVWWFGDVVDARALIDTKLHDIEVEDCGSASITFSSGVLGSLWWTTCVYNKNYEGSITIIGEYGTIKIGGPYLNTIDFWDVRSFPLPHKTAFVDQPNSYGKYQGTSSNHDKVIREVIKKLLKEKYNGVVEGDQGIKTIEAIEKIYERTHNKS
jgi:UDP-N-acetyl-2-amino-2-deoxyglucuronate dehydrogenase